MEPATDDSRTEDVLFRKMDTGFLSWTSPQTGVSTNFGHLPTSDFLTMKLKPLLILTGLFFSLSGYPQSPEFALKNQVTIQWMKEKLPRHSPRLILSPGGLVTLKARIKTDSLCRIQYLDLAAQAESFLTLPGFQRTMTGRRLLDVSRDAVRRLAGLSLVYRISGDKRFLKRAEQDMLAISRFTDWNPGHFLDVAEMTLAVSLALDWCGKDLALPVRKQAREAVKRHILFSFADNSENWNWWVKGDNNWNQVCHGGLVAGALILAEEEPELSSKVIARALDNIPKAMKAYFPDGAYVEGPSYWTYGTSYTALTSSLLESAFGTDFGVSNLPGVMESALYRLEMRAGTGMAFNYFDSGDLGLTRSDFNILAWFALKTGDRLFLPWQLCKRSPGGEGNRFASLALIWSSSFRETKNSSLPSAWKGQGPNPLAVLRSDADGFYLGAKGSSASLHHANMDGGSFVFENQGVRWAVDPGNQEYEGLEQVMGGRLWAKQQSSERWTLLTKNNFFHNTLTVNDSLHKVQGSAQMVDFDAKAGKARFDLSSLFGNLLASARRTFTRKGQDGLEICDSLILNPNTRSVSWTMMSTAEVQPVPGGAVLISNGKTLRLEVLEPAGIQVSVHSLSPPPLAWDKNIPGLKKLEVRVPAWVWKEGEGRIRILLH